jgi:putative tryptophan/tyrosine transport system substrate-binding protein
MSDMKRREFISLLGGAAAAWPLAARAQQPAMPVIGYLSGKSPEAEAPLREPFIKALEASGFAAGRNVAIEYRFAEGQDDRLPALAADLIRERPAVLVAMDTGSALAAKAATKTIPIVFGVGSDPVRFGLVETLNRPGGNATGTYVFVTHLGPKRLQLLREVVPQATLIAFIVNPTTAAGPAQKSEMESAAKRSDSRSLFSTHPPRARSTKPLPRLLHARPMQSSTAPVCFSRSCVTGSWRWPRGIRFQPSMNGPSSPRLVD